MNISRRQLYAFGEPLGEGVTRLKPGGRIYGGGDSPSTPADTTNVQTMELPEWARGYAKDTLAKASALTDINKNPYQQYGGQRIAGFQPLQEQAFKTVGGMDAGPAGFQANIGQYMSPYMQNVVDVEKLGALRDYQIGNTMQQAQATQAGAFGGGRDAIMRAERERSLMGNLRDIQARGSQAAYEQAANQFRQGIQQQSGLAQLQGQMGAQQQQQAQRPLDVAYQDFLNQQNYPYKQLGFMSDMVRGLPLGQQSTAQMYQAPPSTLQTMGALGLGAYGINQLMKGASGGLAMGDLVNESEPVVRYAGGGGIIAFADGDLVDSSVAHTAMDDPVQMAKAVAKLSDEQLQQIIQHPSSAAELQAAKTELATRASESRGLASAYNMMPQQAPQQMPQQMQQPTVQAARGGIMAFNGDDESLVTNENKDPDEILAALGLNQLSNVTGDPEQYKAWNQKLSQAFENLSNYQPRTMTEDQRRANTLANYKEVMAMAGPSPYEAQEKRIAELEGQRAGNLEQQKGLAALAAIPSILEGGNAVRGLGKASGTISNLYGKALQADREEKRSLMSMRNNLEDAQYKMRVGMIGDARQLTAEARRDAQAADAAGIQKQKALGVLAAQGVRLNAPPKPVAQKATPAESQALQNLENWYIQNTQPKKGETEEQRVIRAKGLATKDYLYQKGQRDIRSNVSSVQDFGVVRGGLEESKIDVSKEELSSKETMAASTAAKKAALRNEDWQNATTQAEKDAVEQRLYEAELDKIRQGKQKLSDNKPASTTKPAAVQPLPANPKPTDLKDGVVYSTPKGNARWNAKTQKFTPVP